MKLTPPFQITTGSHGYMIADSAGRIVAQRINAETRNELLALLNRPEAQAQGELSRVAIETMQECVALQRNPPPPSPDPVAEKRQAAWDVRVAKADLTQERIAAALEKITERMPSREVLMSLALLVGATANPETTGVASILAACRAELEKEKGK
jgi:hypothetical protein